MRPLCCRPSRAATRTTPPVSPSPCRTTAGHSCPTCADCGSACPRSTSLRGSTQRLRRPYALAVYYIIAPSECSANLARYDGVKFGHGADAPNIWEAMSRARAEGFGPEVKRRIMLGTYALSAGYYDAYYKKAQQVRTLISREFAAAFERYDLLVTPTSPILPFRLGEKTQDPVSMYLF